MGSELVTGGAGSIGLELVKKLVLKEDSPELIVVLDSSEFGLFSASRALEPLRKASQKVEYLLGDVRDPKLVSSVLNTYQISTIYHAAACKHVPILEHPHNAIEGIRTNVLGTEVVLRSAIESGVDNFVLISTDKAVNPASMMGATKTLAEMIACEYRDLSPTKVSIVRFGNVIGSSGSVYPLFREQAAVGGPITVTHKDMYRCFMTIEAAVSLVLQSIALGEGTYVLDMGDPISINDIALEIAEEYLATRNSYIPIQYIGIRPGEKLVEELFYEHESPATTEVPRVLRINSEGRGQYILPYLSSLRGACDTRNLNSAISIIKKVAPYTGGILCEVL